ncbi:hypothetical protein GCM10009549_29160 [Streptomyces thermoalcalitolerans]|uniref:Uncharacterized protein n=1 Tax=Streptomyces thermoalcalitolerans TaxID=65605 RepID=A0ABN1NR61_9ACTN
MAFLAGVLIRSCGCRVLRCRRHVPGTSSSVFLAGFLGHRDELAAAEAAYASGALDSRQACELDAAGWAGVPEDRVFAWLDGLPLVSGITETVAWCRRNGLVPMLATLAWSHVGRYLTDRGHSPRPVVCAHR